LASFVKSKGWKPVDCSLCLKTNYSETGTGAGGNQFFHFKELMDKSEPEVHFKPNEMAFEEMLKMACVPKTSSVVKRKILLRYDAWRTVT